MTRVDPPHLVRSSKQSHGTAPIALWVGLTCGLSACQTALPARRVPLLECARALAAPAQRPDVATAMAVLGDPASAWQLLGPLGPSGPRRLANTSVARAAAERGDDRLGAAVLAEVARQGTTEEVEEVHAAASLGFLAAGRSGRARAEAERAASRAPWLAGSAVLLERGEPERARVWLTRAAADPARLDAPSALLAVRLARALGELVRVREALGRARLPHGDARVTAAWFLAGDAARARAHLSEAQPVGPASTAVEALFLAGLEAEALELGSQLAAPERTRALARLASTTRQAHLWGAAAAAAPQVEEPRARVDAWLTLAEARQPTSEPEARAWLQHAEQAAEAVPEAEDRDEALVEVWGRAGDCTRAARYAAGRTSLLRLAAFHCSDASHLEALERASRDLERLADRDLVRGALVKTALHLEQPAPAVRLMGQLETVPELVWALLDLAFSHPDTPLHLIPRCGAGEGRP